MRTIKLYYNISEHKYTKCTIYDHEPIYSIAIGNCFGLFTEYQYSFTYNKRVANVHCIDIKFHKYMQKHKIHSIDGIYKMLAHFGYEEIEFACNIYQID